MLNVVCTVCSLMLNYCEKDMKGKKRGVVGRKREMEGGKGEIERRDTVKTTLMVLQPGLIVTQAIRKKVVYTL